MVPGNVDLLVAGFSCVDFSILNNSPRTLEERGESGDTLFAILQYMVEFHPKIVILENVKGAPWIDEKISEKKRTSVKKGEKSERKGIDFHVGEAGYASRLITVDTKNFYLPHTRQRRYMICINKMQAYSGYCKNAKVGPNDEEIDRFCDPKYGGLNIIFDHWQKVVKLLGREASVRVDAMLLEEDDVRLTGLRDGENENNRKRKAGAWAKCKNGHQEYRTALGLGGKHILTDWLDDTFKLPDHFPNFSKGATQRVLDTLDIAHLRNLFRGFDDRYYR